MTALMRMRGRDLTGAARTLPDDLADAPAVLLIGFAEAHQAFIDLWFAALDAVDVPKLEVPVASTRQRMFARYIESGMVPGVPAPRHSTTVVVYTDVRALMSSLGLSGPVPAAIVLDPEGRVRDVEIGEPDDASVARVLQALSAPAG